MTETLKGACLCARVQYEVQDLEALGYHDIGGDAPQFAENPPA